jgi:arabinan endo-1,5-alpha-L-arabinosidase
MVRLSAMSFRRFALIPISAFLLAAGADRQPELLPLQGDIQAVHDPVIIKERDTYYVFCTGRRPGGGGIIPIRTSKDMREWTLGGAVFERLPEWCNREVPAARDAWAPDISFFNGKFHLYYAVSTFGRNLSAIGLATNTTLDPTSPQYKWEDQGMVLRSSEGVDDFNAIDANLVIENRNSVWLNWGSFWGGIKMRKLDFATGKLSHTDTTLYSLCARPRSKPGVTPPVQGAVEAPFLVRHDGYWYLFVSYDFCCRGAKSDYNVVVGRSKKVTGPYVDRQGKPLAEGAGTPVLSAQTSKWHGAGHEAVWTEKNQDYLVFHAYEAVNGRPFLNISTMIWEKGWPKVAAMP